MKANITDKVISGGSHTINFSDGTYCGSHISHEMIVGRGFKDFVYGEVNGKFVQRFERGIQDEAQLLTAMRRVIGGKKLPPVIRKVLWFNFDPKDAQGYMYDTCTLNLTYINEKMASFELATPYQVVYSGTANYEWGTSLKTVWEGTFQLLSAVEFKGKGTAVPRAVV